jgi:transcriptional regulator with XRE-family HTH domain
MGVNVMLPMAEHEIRREQVTRWRSLVRRAYGPLKQSDVAQETGISQPWVNQIANGRVPSREKLAQLAEGLKMEPRVAAELFELAGYPVPPTMQTPADRLLTGLKALARLYGEEHITLQSSAGPLPSLAVTDEQVDELLRFQEGSARRTYAREGKDLPEPLYITEL